MELYLTMEEVLRLPAFQGCRIAAGRAGLQKRVTGVNVSEVPDYYHWLAAGEVMLCTCYALYEDPVALEQFIPQLEAHGMAGVCIKPGRFLGELPKYMIDCAEERSFPLIELPEEARFADITKAITDELLKRRTAQLENSLSVNRMLVSALTKRASLEELAGTVASITGCSVWVVDRINHRLASCLSPDYPEQERRDRPPADAVAHELRADGQLAGMLYLSGQQVAAEEEILAPILQLIPPEILQTRSVYESESRGFREFLTHLLMDPIRDEQREQQRGKTFGLDLIQQHLLLYCGLAEPQGIQSKELLYQNVLLQQIKAFLQQEKYLFHMLQQEEACLFLVEGSDLTALPQGLERLLRGQAGGIAAGLSQTHRGITGLRRCDWESRLAARMAGKHGGFCRFDELGVLRLLYAEDTQSEIKHFVQDTLQSLITRDDPYHADLLRTLEAYFALQGNQRSMAKALFVHYNTIAYRLRTIEELCGVELNDPDDRLQLELALYLRKNS